MNRSAFVAAAGALMLFSASPSAANLTQSLSVTRAVEDLEGAGELGGASTETYLLIAGGLLAVLYAIGSILDNATGAQPQPAPPPVSP